MFRRVKLRELERAIAWRPGRNVRWLEPGAHWLLGFGWNVRVFRAGEKTYRLPGTLPLAQLSRLPEARSDLAFACLAPNERALVFVEGRLAHVLGPGVGAVMALGHKVRVEVHDARALVLDPGVPVAAALSLDRCRRVLREAIVPAGHAGFLFLDERLVAELVPGHYATWRRAGAMRFETVPLGAASLVRVVPDAWTRDLATVSASLAVAYRVEDPGAWARSHGRARAALQGAIETGLRRVFGSAPLARVLGDSTALELTLEKEIASLV
ncbi:MAG TPA: SPFH domain-containing protein, partial [Planctomycetota bacterium]|nr:SPFH domain-containing protein [Planctomycetota bacterium]